MNAPLPLATANALPAAEFTARFGAVFEHAPWVAEAAARARPFASAEALITAMLAAMRAGGATRLDTLLRAHPELGGAAARAGRLTPASTEEQASLGLATLEAAHAARLAEANARYRARFGFPFIIAVRGQRDPAAILAALEARLANDQAAERATALAEVEKIARFRLAALLGEETR